MWTIIVQRPASRALYGMAAQAQSWIEDGAPQVLVSGGSWDASAIGGHGRGMYPRVWHWNGAAWGHLETTTAPADRGDPVLRVGAGHYWTAWINGSGYNRAWERDVPADWERHGIADDGLAVAPQIRLVGTPTDLTIGVNQDVLQPTDEIAWWHYDGTGWGTPQTLAVTLGSDPHRWWTVDETNGICRTPDGTVRVCGSTTSPTYLNGTYPFIAQIRGAAVGLEAVLTPDLGFESRHFRCMFALNDAAIYAAADDWPPHYHNEVWFSAGGGIWNPMPAFPESLLDNFAPRAIGGSSTSDLWVAGEWSNGPNTEPVLAHWDGAAWTPTGFPAYGWPTTYYGPGFRDITAAGANDVWAVGTRITSDTDPFDTTEPFILHWDGATWMDVTPVPLA